MATANSSSATPLHSENAEEELERIQLALAAVYSSEEAASSGQWFAQRSQANQYLTSFQSTPVAWMVCDRLLQEGNNRYQNNNLAHQQQAQFFAAQTLHTKCRVDMFQLPPESLPPLRDSLVNHLQRLIGESRALKIRLAMCISALAVQMEWLTIVSDLLAAPPTTPPQVELTLLILQSLPEECASDRLLLQDESSRFKMRDCLISSSPDVLQFLHSHMQNADRVLEVLHLWIRYVPVQSQALLESPLLVASIQALRDPNFLDAASDVVVEVLRMYPSHHPGNEPLVAHMIPQLSSLPLLEALQSEDEDVLQAYCRVITEMGESYMSILLSKQQPELSRQLVGGVLQCARTPQHEIASMTLHFWYRLVLDMESVDQHVWRQELIDDYTPQLLELLEVCVTSLMRYPADLDELPDDRLEDLQKHRFYVAETIDDCCRLLGGNMVVQRINELWDAFSQQSWQSLESCMACLCAIHQFISKDDQSPVISKCFQIIPQLPTNIVPLRRTCCRTIGKYASWLAVHTQFTMPLLPYLAESLKEKQCASSAAIAIRELCEVSNSTFSLANPVMTLYQELQPGMLDIDSELEILHGGCRALSRQIQETRESGDGTKTMLSQLAQPIGTRLATSVHVSAQQIIPDIQRLTVIVQHLVIPYDRNATTGVHPMLELTSSSWSFLETAVSRFPNDPNLSEMICRLHKYTLRTCGAEAYSPNLDRLLTFLVQSFEKSHQSPYLYAASICVTEYASDSRYTDRLIQMIVFMANSCFSFLRDLETMTAKPDVVEEFFYLVERMIKHCPDPLIVNPLMEKLLQFASEGLKLEHFGANKGVLKFVDSTVSYGLALRNQPQPTSQASLEQAVANHGQGLVANLAHAITGELPGYNLHQITGITWKFHLLCPSLLRQWLDYGLKTSSLPDKPKADFMTAFHTGLSENEFSLVVRSFQSTCHRERRMQRQRGL